MSLPITYLLDTNVVSEMMRPNPMLKVAEFLDIAAEEGIGLATITIWEILDGIGRLPAGRRRQHLVEQFQGILTQVFEERILDWTLTDAQACAHLMEEKRRKGESLDDHLPDAILAGTALSRGLIVVTRNEREFRNTGVKIVNPWEGTNS